MELSSSPDLSPYAPLSFWGFIGSVALAVGIGIAAYYFYYRKLDPKELMSHKPWRLW